MGIQSEHKSDMNQDLKRLQLLNISKRHNGSLMVVTYQQPTLPCKYSMGKNQLNRYNFPNRVYVFTELSEVKFYNHGLLTNPCYEVELTMFPIVFPL